MIAADSARSAKPTRGAVGTRADGGSDPAKQDQRLRLLEAIVELVAGSGYTQARVGDLASSAGVSRATFYEQFKNKEECFLAAHDELSKRLLADAEDAVGKQRGHATASIVAMLTKFAAQQPRAFSFLTYEAMVAGPTAMDRRERLIAALAEQLEQAPVAGKRAARSLQVPAWILLGGVIRLLGIRMRRDQPDCRALPPELAGWIESYRAPGAAKQARRPRSTAPLLDVGQRVAPGLLAPQPLPRGRHRLPSAVVRRVQRERILHATAQVIMAKGYAGTTVADIVAAAGVSREVFYSHFRSRSEAFVETHQLVFEQMMAATAGAFFASGGPWPEQVWHAARASTKFVLDAPSFGHFAFIESYALGESIARRTDEAILAFTALLAKGYAQRPEAAELPHSISDAIVCAIMEAVAHQLRNGRGEDLVHVLPLITYVVIAPFIGAKDASTFIDGKLSELQAG